VKGDPIPDRHHVARYVGGTHVDNGRVVGNAFLRRRGESGPSVHWLEMLAGDVGDHIDQLRRRSRLDRRPSAVFARLNVGATRRHVADNVIDHRKIAFIHDPLDAKPPNHPLDDPSHALIDGLPHPDDTPQAEAIGDLIAETVLDTFPARGSAE
jgi:hypothetical protein